MHIYSEKEEDGQEKKKTKYIFRRKVALGNVMLEPRSVLSEIKKFKEKPNAKCNKESGDLRARPHSAKLPTCEKELMKSLSSEGNHQQLEADTM